MGLDQNLKRVRFPLKLNLIEVTEQPKTYICDHISGELSEPLRDLIGPNPYFVQIEIHKAGNAYLLNGLVKTQMSLVCSDCSGDYQEPVDLKFQEVLVINSPLQKGDQSTRANHSHEWADDQPQCTYLDSSYFEVAEFLHEQIALSEPSRPTGAVDPKHACEDVASQVQRDWLSIGKGSASDVHDNPFKALENLKLKG